MIAMTYYFGGTGVPPTANEDRGTRDGTTAADHDLTYVQGDHLTTDYHPWFTTRQFSKLLCLKSHVQDGTRTPPTRSLVAALGAPACFDDDCPACRAFMASVDV